LLDHVDGQLARLRKAASLDGTELDYLMHHTVNLLVPLGVGAGVFARTAEPLWLLAGLVWGIGALLVTLQHDARAKAFVKRLKRVRGRLEAIGGGGARPEPQPAVPRRPLRLLAWAIRKACEPHVVMNVLGLLTVGQWLIGDTRLVSGSIYLAAMGPLAIGVVVWDIVRSQRRGTAEREFAAWYRVPEGHELVFAEGWWFVQASEDGNSGKRE